MCARSFETRKNLMLGTSDAECERARSHKSRALCAAREYRGIECSLAELDARGSAVHFSCINLPTPVHLPPTGVKLAELSIRGTYAVDLIRKKRRPRCRAVLHRKTAPRMVLDRESENMIRICAAGLYVIFPRLPRVISAVVCLWEKLIKHS